MHTLYEGAALAVIVVLLFLRDWRATAIAAIRSPLSIFPAFWVTHLLGFSLNLVSLLAITLSVGILVDDAIVEIENIVRHIQMGKSAYRAAIDAADEIGLAVIAITLTIVAMFLPASFLSSVPGQFFKQFGITVSVQVLFSCCGPDDNAWLAAYFLKPRRHEERTDGPISRIYQRILRWSLKHRFITVALGLALFVATLASASVLPSGFMPPADSSRSVLSIQLPPGSQLSDTEAVTDAITNRLRNRPEVESVFVDGGRLPPSVLDIGRAALTINYVPKSERKLSQQQLEQAITSDLFNVPDIRFWFLDKRLDCLREEPMRLRKAVAVVSEGLVVDGCGRCHHLFERLEVARRRAELEPVCVGCAECGEVLSQARQPARQDLAARRIRRDDAGHRVEQDLQGREALLAVDDVPHLETVAAAPRSAAGRSRRGSAARSSLAPRGR